MALRCTTDRSADFLTGNYTTRKPTNDKLLRQLTASVSSWPDPFLFSGAVVFRSTPTKQTMLVNDDPSDYQPRLGS